LYRSIRSSFYSSLFGAGKKWGEHAVWKNGGLNFVRIQPERQYPA